MSDRATLRRLLREHAEAVSTETAFIKEDAIFRLFDTVQNEHDAQVAALTAALEEANEDAARLASSLENDAYPFPIRRSIDEKDAALRAHRARVGGAS